jgi:hypothetical protein
VSLAQPVLQALLDVLAQPAASQQPEPLRQAQPVRVAQLVQAQVLRQQALEFLLQLWVRVQEVQLLEQRQAAARQPERALRLLVQLRRAHVLQLLRLLPSRLFLKSRRLRRQLRLALIVGSAF